MQHKIWSVGVVCAFSGFCNKNLCLKVVLVTFILCLLLCLASETSFWMPLVQTGLKRDG